MDNLEEKTQELDEKLQEAKTDGVRDYHDFCTKDTPESERRKYNVGNIWINAARCLKCGDEIRSRNRHDYRYCGCGNIAVDGGSWYIKRVTKEVDYDKEMNTLPNPAYENIIEFFSDVGPQ